MGRLTIAVLLIGWAGLGLFIAACFRAAAASDKASDELADRIAHGDVIHVPRDSGIAKLEALHDGRDTL